MTTPDPAFVVSKGTTVSVGGDTVGHVVSVSGIGNSVEMIDVTCLADTRKIYLGGLPDGGDVSMSIRTDMTDTHQTSALLALSQSPAPVAVVVSGTDTNTTAFTITFTGILSDFSIESIEVNNVYMTNATFKVNSDIVFG